jgi:hypothetical protein
MKTMSYVKGILAALGLVGVLALPACNRSERADVSDNIEKKTDRLGERVDEGANDVQRSAEDLAD